MEKINNYTPVKFRISRVHPLCGPGPDYIDDPSLGFSATLHNDVNEMSIDVWGHHLSKEQTESVAKLIALAPTLYEQHFKMLEALKYVAKYLNKGGFGRVDALQKIEQTIKECEL